MKRAIFIALGIILLGLVVFGLKLNSDLNKIEEAFGDKHSLSNSKLVLLRTEKAPNGNHAFYEYQFDNGGFGYSRIFWSVKTSDSTSLNLEKGLLPDCYKIVRWTADNDLLIKRWTPYYAVKNDMKLSNGDEINGVTIKVID